MDIQIVEEPEKNIWNTYVFSHSSSAFYHLFEWKYIIEETFHHDTFYLLAKSKKGTVTGVLPLVLMQSSLFGCFMISLPYDQAGRGIT